MMCRFSKFLLIFILVTSWVFSGLPQIWHNPSFPSKVQKVQAAPPQTSITDAGTNNSTITIAPGAVATDAGRFTVQDDKGGGSTQTSVTVTFPANVVDGIALVQIWDATETTGYLSATSPTGDTFVLTTGTGLPTNTTATEFHILVTPKSHAAMPVPNGASYAATAHVTACSGGHNCSASDTADNVVTIDNTSPSAVTSTSGSVAGGDNQVALNWTTSVSSDFSRSVVLRWAASSAGSEVPDEGTDYSVDDTITTATVACVRTGDAASTAVSDAVDGTGGGGCSLVSLTGGQDYSYKIFQKDSNGNYDTGTVPTGSPFTPTGSPVYSVSITSSGTIEYGFVDLGVSTTTAGNGYTQTANHDGSGGPEKLNVKSSDATGGTQWTLGTSPGSDIFKHEVSTTSGSTYMTFQATDTYLTASSSVAVSDTVNLDFRLTAPSASTDYQQKSITITVQAVAP